MIFSNNGHTQIGGDPTENIIEITQIIRTLRARYEEIEGEEFVNKMLVFAGRLSMLSEEDEESFHASIAGRSLKIEELIKRLEEFTETE